MATKDPRQVRGRALASYGEAFVALDVFQQDVVYGLLHGGAWSGALQCPMDWLQAAEMAARASQPTRKDWCMRGVALCLGLGVALDESAAVTAWEKGQLAYESNCVLFLGLCAHYGRGGKSCDASVALALVTRAAEMGHLEAMWIAGKWLMEGRGCELSAEGATKWWIKGSGEGHMACRYSLAMCYWEGRGVSEATGVCQSYDEAVKLLRRVTGEPGAAERVALALEKGYVLTEEAKKARDAALAEGKREAERLRKERAYPVFLGRAHTSGGASLDNRLTGSAPGCPTCGEGDPQLWVGQTCWVCRQDWELAAPNAEKRAEIASHCKRVAAAHVRSDNFEASLRCCRRAVQLCPNSLGHCVNLAAALSVQRQWYSCTVECERILGIIDGNSAAVPVLCTLAGRAHVQLGKFEQARALLTRGQLDERDGDIAALSRVEGLLASMEQQVAAKNALAAVATFQGAPSSIRENCAVRSALVASLYALERHEEVLREGGELLRCDLDPVSRATISTLHTLALLYASTDLPFVELLARLEKAAIHCGSEHFTRVTRVAALVEQCSLEALGAISSVDDRFIKCERMALLYQACARRLLDAGTTQEAVELIARALRWPQVEPGEAAALLREAGRQCEAGGRVEEAIMHYSLFVEVVHPSSPPYEDVLFSRATLYQQCGRLKEAKADFARLRELRPESQRYDQWFRRTSYMRHFAKGLPDFYVVLGVAANADQKEIRAAFKARALATHPDKQGGGEVDTAKVFQRVHEAYATLSDPQKRAEYDELHSVFV